MDHCCPDITLASLTAMTTDPKVNSDIATVMFFLEVCSRGKKKAHIGALICAPGLVCALVCVLVCAPKLVCVLVCALICAPKLVWALVCAPKFVCKKRALSYTMDTILPDLGTTE